MWFNFFKIRSVRLIFPSLPLLSYFTLIFGLVLCLLACGLACPTTQLWGPERSLGIDYYMDSGNNGLSLLSSSYKLYHYQGLFHSSIYLLVYSRKNLRYSDRWNEQYLALAWKSSGFNFVSVYFFPTKHVNINASLFLRLLKNKSDNIILLNSTSFQKSTNS